MYNCVSHVAEMWWLIADMYIYNTDEYRKISNITRTLIGNQMVDHSDVVGTAPLGNVPTTPSFLT